MQDSETQDIPEEGHAQPVNFRGQSSGQPQKLSQRRFAWKHGQIFVQGPS
jgi:hypothetical protein